MSQPAKKLPAPPTAVPTPDGDGSGRFVIAHRLDPMLPPSDGQADEVLSLDAIGGLELPDATDSTPPPAPATVSGVFASGHGPREPESDPIADGLASMRPYYTTSEQQSEHVELIVEDLSLRLDNPYAASSLVPPPRKPLPVGKILGVAAALIALGSGAWFATRAFENARTQHAPVAAAPHVVAVPQAPAPVAPAPAAKVEAPVAVQAPAPVEEAPVPVAAKAAPVASKTAREQRVTAPVAHQSDSDEVKAALSAALKNEAPAVPAPAEQPVAAPAAEPTVAATSAAPAAVPTDALGALPDLPTREEIVAGFEQARGAIETCAAGKHGLVKIQATIANSGRVASAVIDGAFVGTPEGSCMARAVRATRFPAFSQASLKVSFPIAL
jgi:hypothetical protein